MSIRYKLLSFRLGFGIPFGFRFQQTVSLWSRLDDDVKTFHVYLYSFVLVLAIQLLEAQKKEGVVLRERACHLEDGSAFACRMR